jgi:hypothetical protein
MANIKRYIVEHTPTCGSIRVEIDFDFIMKIDDNTSLTMNEMIKQMVDFVYGSENLVKENNGDYVKTYLIMLCGWCFELYDSLGLKKLIDDVNDTEGYYKVDGSEGIKLLAFTEPCFDYQIDFEVKEMKP